MKRFMSFLFVLALCAALAAGAFAFGGDTDYGGDGGGSAAMTAAIVPVTHLAPVLTQAAL